MTKKKKEEISKFVSSGSTLLNLALSGLADGGWRIGRIANIVGDKSTGKTLLAIEAITHALKVLGKREKVKAIYDETEAAFDIPYAEMLGLPVGEVIFKESKTVEEWYKTLDEEMDKPDYDLMIYVTDSLDAISSNREAKGDFDKLDYDGKAKKVGELFRRLIKKVEKKRVLILIISQIRDNIGVKFGKKTKRSGGRAMDFYASQVLWLSEIEKLKVADRVVGVDIRGKVDKNKVWKPYREATFPILFEYGVDDVGSMSDFLIEQKVIEKSGNRWMWKDVKYYREALIQKLEDNIPEVITLTKLAWKELEEKCKVTRKPKYE